MKTINDYAELVKEKHALNKTIAPVETDLTDASRGYHIGEQFINNGEIFKAKTEIAQHDALVLNTNYEPADNLIEQIKNAGGGTGTDPRLDVFENNIAPVETDETDASRPYQVGEQLILNNILYDVIAAISEHDVITTTGSGANIAPADPISLEIEALTNQANDMVNVLGAKNLIPYPYHRQNGYTANGATFTYDDEGVITVNKVVGNSTAYFALFSNILYPDAEKFLEPNTSYILSMELENATDTSCFVQTQNGSDLAAIRNKTTGKYEISFTTTETVDSLAVALYYGAEKTENNAKVKLMIRLASINDSTYVPYAKTNRQLTAENQTLTNNVSVLAENGAINNLPSEAVTKTVTTDGANLTFTVNEDKSVTVNGTSGSNTVRYAILGNAGSPAIYKAVGGKGPYKISGINNGSADTYFLVFQASNSTSGTHTEAHDLYDGEKVIGDYSYYRCYIVIKAGVTLNNVKFEPMMVSPSYSGDYVPYAKTNRELTDESELITLPATKNDSIVGSFVIRVRKQHNTVYVTGYFNITVAANRNDLLFTISDLNFFDANDHFYILMMSSDGDTSFAEVYSNGEVKVGKNTGMPIGYYMVDSVLLMK